MKVIVSAYACEPDRGSEPGVGWNVVRCLSQKHNLTVLTRSNNKGVIDARKESWVQNVNWEYLDPPRWMTFWKKGSRGTQLFYILWQMAAYRRVKSLLKGQDFDIIHHLTFGKYWVPSFLASFHVPFIFGPVGGGEKAPAVLLSGLPAVAGVKEKIQQKIKTFVSRFPGLNGLYLKAAWTFAATPQTERALRDIGVSQVSVLPQSGIGDDEVSEFLINRRPNDRPGGKRIELVTACRLISWKAVDLAIEAVAVARARGRNAHLVVLQTGSELEALKSLVKKLGVADFVEFRGRQPSLESVYSVISGADALVHPALQEAFGQACLEAMALGVPVICLDWGGPGLIVDESCGFKIKVGPRHDVVEGLADAICELEDSPENLATLRRNATKRAHQQFSWKKLAREIDSMYQTIADQHSTI